MNKVLNAKWISNPVNKVTICIVATQPENAETFTVRIMPIKGLSETVGAQFAADWGAKLSEAEGRAFFPNIDKPYKIG